MIWLVIIAMTLAAMAWLLIPVLKRQAAPDRPDYDRAVFRDQLKELDRDLAQGVIGGAEASAARNEISRRLLHSVPSTRRSPSRTPLMAILGVLLIPAVALPLYLQHGSPKLADVPLKARLDNAVKDQDFDAMIAKVERHLAEKPGDVQGWMVLAAGYRKVQRWNDAANAYANIMRLTKASPETIADYGEMVVLANQGMVTAEATRAFEQALRLDPKLPKARYFNALALKQEGKREEALAAIRVFLTETPADAPWRPALEDLAKELGWSGVP
ncbi:MAG: c-type cytochrome biogenesis protein CcmI [Aestuariivirga sp.]